MDCWACRLAEGDPHEIETRLWFYHPALGICVEDLHSKRYWKRLLYVVPSHVACEQVSEGLIYGAKSLMEERVLPSFYKLHPEGRLVAWDLYDHTYSEHWHLQACFEKP